MGGQMGGERVERRFDRGCVAGRGRRMAERPEPGRAEGVGGEEAVQIGAADAAVGRLRAFGAVADHEPGVGAAGAFGAAEMDLVALHGKP